MVARSERALPVPLSVSTSSPAKVLELTCRLPTCKLYRPGQMDDCPICCSFLVDPLVLGCSHTFCRLCLVQTTRLTALSRPASVAFTSFDCLKPRLVLPSKRLHALDASTHDRPHVCLAVLTHPRTAVRVKMGRQLAQSCERRKVGFDHRVESTKCKASATSFPLAVRFHFSHTAHATQRLASPTPLSVSLLGTGFTRTSHC